MTRLFYHWDRENPLGEVFASFNAVFERNKRVPRIGGSWGGPPGHCPEAFTALMPLVPDRQRLEMALLSLAEAVFRDDVTMFDYAMEWLEDHDFNFYTKQAQKWLYTTLCQRGSRGELVESSGGVFLIKRLLALLTCNDLNRMRYNATPLMRYAQRGFATTVQLLLTSGFEVDVDKCSGHRTPLQEAVTRGHVDVVRVLLAHGANPALCHLPKGRTAIQQVEVHRAKLHKE